MYGYVARLEEIYRAAHFHLRPPCFLLPPPFTPSFLYHPFFLFFPHLPSMYWRTRSG